MTNRERRIREIAYHLWEQEGRPEGESDSHRLWLAAEAQFQAEVTEVTERKDAGSEPPPEAAVEPPAEPVPAVKKPIRPAKPKTDEPAAAKPARSAKPKAAEPAPEKKAGSAKAKAAEPAAEKPAGSGKRKPGAK